MFPIFSYFYAVSDEKTMEIFKAYWTHVVFGLLTNNPCQKESFFLIAFLFC